MELESLPGWCSNHLLHAAFWTRLVTTGAKTGARADWQSEHCWYFDTESLRHHTVTLTAHHLSLMSGDTAAFLAMLPSLASAVEEKDKSAEEWNINLTIESWRVTHHTLFFCFFCFHVRSDRLWKQPRKTKLLLCMFGIKSVNKSRCCVKTSVAGLCKFPHPAHSAH